MADKKTEKKVSELSIKLTVEECLYVAKMYENSVGRGNCPKPTKEMASKLSKIEKFKG